MSDVYIQEIERLRRERQSRNHHLKRIARLNRERAAYYAAQYPLDLLVDAVEKFYRVGKRELFSDERFTWTVKARHHLYWLIRTKRPDMSYPMIGQYVGKDHSSVVHGAHKVARTYDGVTLGAVDKIVERLREEAGISDDLGLGREHNTCNSGARDNKLPASTTENNFAQT